ncbi:MAG: hypothetical protein A2013_01110 [Tenericutes bacterium GWE2_38_8]|nr:MAG: hypothetical protein A2013_01110 [Tenericutes bacterium GWE2_38_8]
MRNIKRLLINFIFILMLVSLFACTKAPTIEYITLNNNNQTIEIELDQFEVHDIVFRVVFSDGSFQDVTLDLSMLSESDQAKLSTLGNHSLTINYQGFTTSFNLHIIEPEIIYALANGRYDLSTLSASERAQILSQLEGYLLDNMYGGIPLFSQSKAFLLSDRVLPYRDTYNSQLGFGIPYSTLTEDDSTVKFSSETYGVANEFTFRTAYTYETFNLLYWFNPIQNELLEFSSGSLYKKVFNDSVHGFDIVPSLAEGEPEPINPIVNHNQSLSYLWKINIKDNLSWAFHEDTPLNNLDEVNVLNAIDFVWTWKTALQDMWPGVTTGSFSINKQDIKNVDAYLSGQSDLDDVGIKVSTESDFIIELEFDELKSSDDIKLFLSTLSYAPIHKGLYESIGLAYGTTMETTPSSGLYVLDSWIPNQQISFKLNTNHPDYLSIHYTGYNFRYFIGQTDIYSAFLNGELDIAYVPDAFLSNHIEDPQLYIENGSTTWRLNINAFGTEQARDSYIDTHPNHPMDEHWIPEPILSYLNMRQALYFGIDRENLVNDAGMKYKSEHMLISSAYFHDAQSGLTLRDDPNGIELEQFYNADGFGFDEVLAKSNFHDAVTQSILDGYYEAGTEESYTIISLTLRFVSSGNNTIKSMMDAVKAQYESLLIDDVHFVKIEINLEDIAFPMSYMQWSLYTASFDLALGGLSGSVFDLPQYFQTFSDLETNDFLSNYGIDTTSPLLDISYHDDEGNIIYEKWGFNALVEALNGKTDIKNGDIQTTFDSVLDLVESYMSIQEIQWIELNQIDALGVGLLGQSLSSYANDLGVDEISAWVVVTGHDDSMLFVIIKEGNDYKLDQYRILNHDVAEVMQHYITEFYGYYELIEFHQMTLNIELQNHVYLQQYYDYQTFDDIALFYGVPVNQLVVYSTTWESYSGTQWDDVFILLQIEGYLIPLDWL